MNWKLSMFRKKFRKIIKTANITDKYVPSSMDGIDEWINKFIEDSITEHSAEEPGYHYIFDYKPGFKVIDIKYSTAIEEGELIEGAFLIYEMNFEKRQICHIH